MSSEEEAKPQPEIGTESGTQGRDVTTKIEEVKVRRRGRPKRKEEEKRETVPEQSTEQVYMQNVKQVISMLTKYKRVLDKMDERLRPIKRIEKESSTIKLLQKQIRALTKQVTRIEKSVNRLKTSGKGRGRRRTNKGRTKR